MKCSTLITISSLILILLSYGYYNKINLTYTEPPPENLPKLSCKKINYSRLMEDFVKVDDNNIIACGASFSDLYQKYSIYNPGYQLEQGNLILFDLKKEQPKNLEIKNFPENTNFFPHGMKLYKNKYIYVINHGLNSVDGEKIEIFEIIKQKNDIKYLNYVKSIKLPDEFISATNGLAVVDEEDIFFSTSFSVPPPPTDKANFFSKNLFYLAEFFKIYLNLRMTYLYHYKNGIIKKVENSKSYGDNGVAYDDVSNLLFLAQTHEKIIRVYKYEKNGEIKFVKDIYIGYKIDNLIFDEKNRILNAGISGTGGYGGLAEIYPDNNFEIKIPFYDVINVVSASAMKIKRKVYLVSPIAKYLLSCE